MSKRVFTGPSALVLAMLTLAGCGGGGGVGSTPTPAPAPVPTPTPAPVPTPTPTPTPTPVNFNTSEYRSSNGLGASNVIPAYQSGATGLGVTAAVIDSGANPNSPEFAGRISAASQDIAGSRGLGDEGGHGTAVSGVLLAAKNDSGIHGEAFDATLLSLRTDTPGSCTSNGDCSHSDTNIARALDVAVSAGAKVANISLGGAGPNITLRNAISRATAAGMVIVLSAGNDAGANPDDLALIAIDPIARGQIIVAGSYDATKTISTFSNRAGSAANVYLTALGERVLSFDQNGSFAQYSGTSFSAPLVSGAIALLAQAFPNLTGAQLVQLLFDSADDLGTAGTDSVYGRGGLNVGRAFAPRGGASLAGSAIPVDLTATNATLSPAMGDAAQTGLGAVILDGFSRAYAVDFARSIRNAQPRSSLAGALGQTFRGATLAAGGTMVAVSIADAPGGTAMRRLSLTEGDAVRARAAAGLIATRIDPKTSIAVGFGQSGASVAGQLTGRAEPAFLVARASGDALGFDRTRQSAASFRRGFGRLGLTASAESGESLLYRGAPGIRDPYLRAPYSLTGVGLDRRFGALSLSGGVTRLAEDRTVLGAHFGPLFGAGGSASWFGDLRADWRFGRGWSLTVATRQGWTTVPGAGLLAHGATIRSSAYSFDLVRTGLFGRGDQLAFRVAQPLRVESGGLSLHLPVSWDWQTGAVAYADQRLNLAPSGRELDMEASYARMLLGGRMDANLFWRRDPGNFAAAPADLGTALRFRVGF